MSETSQNRIDEDDAHNHALQTCFIWLYRHDNNSCAPPQIGGDLFEEGAGVMRSSLPRALPMYGMYPNHIGYMSWPYILLRV